jgi:uncharacterized protein YbaA (DUF1428 family)
MRYVDGFLIPVPKKKLAAYRKMAATGGKIWMKHGALDYMECVGDDIGKKDWQNVTFADAASAKQTETVIFSFIIFKSRKHRDQVNKKVMADPAMAPEKWEGKAMPFDMKRMAYGGFKAIVDVQAKA